MGTKQKVTRSLPTDSGEWIRARVNSPSAVAMVLAFLDAAAVWVGYYAALPLRFAGTPPPHHEEHLLSLIPLIVLVHLLVNYAFGLYHRVWRYASGPDVLSAVLAAFVGCLAVMAVNLMGPDMRFLPMSSIALGSLLAFIGWISLRYWRGFGDLTSWLNVWLGLQDAPTTQRVVVFGAGEAGGMLAGMLDRRLGLGYEVVGFIDDDESKHGMRLRGRRVFGDRHRIPEVVEKTGAEIIVIASYGLGIVDLREVVALCEESDVVIKVLPNLIDFLNARNGGVPIRDITIQDLLGRDTADIDVPACRDLVGGRTVLVTGAAGSIGSELSRQLSWLGPVRLVLVDNNESGLHDMIVGDLAGSDDDREPGTQIVGVVADVTDRRRMERLFADHMPDIVFHAAAYKHVPLMEAHPQEAFRVNVLGTRNVAELAAVHGADHFVLVSTDKAVRPSSVMGATKRLAELLVRAVAAKREDAGTLFTTVRFGNVLGSRGSVVPTFQRQIDAGGPVTVTDAEMTRYFMSIPEAVSLIIQAAALTRGGDLYMLDMGEPVRIDTLARRLIRFRGLRPNVDIPIVYTGMRPGEKLHEELSLEGESREQTSHPKVDRLHPNTEVDPDQVFDRIDLLALLATDQRSTELVHFLMASVNRPGRAISYRAGDEAEMVEDSPDAITVSPR